MWLVSSMIISIIKFRFHVQSTAQLNYLLSTIVYVPDSKFTFNVANALLYSHRICRELSPPEIATFAPSENALWVFRIRYLTIQNSEYQPDVKVKLLYHEIIV